MLHIRVGTRKSPLAVTQTGEALNDLRKVLPDAEFELIKMETIGDKDLSSDLASDTIPDDFFTRDIDRAHFDGAIDLSIHSTKDLPTLMHPDLVVAALLAAGDIRDALVIRSDLGDTPITHIGTSSPKRIAAIRDIYPDAQAKPIRGPIGERLAQLDAGEYDAVIIAACALERLGIAERIHSYLPYDPAPQQGRLAVVVHRKDTTLLETLRGVDVRRSAGLVALVGCPADITLLPQRARTYLDCADIILHDRLVPDELILAYKDKAVSVGKAGGHQSIPQSEIHRRMLQEAEAGKLVVRLHGGDPGILGHLGESLGFLADWNIRADVVPAVTAAQLAAARAKTSLTHRHYGRSITLLSGHAQDGAAYTPITGPENGNLAIYMGRKDAADIKQRLLSTGWPTDASVIYGVRLGYRDEQIIYTTINEMDQQDVDAPAVMLVGPEGYPAGAYTLFVGTNPEPFLKYGPLVHFPLIKLVNRPLAERVDYLKDHFHEWDGVILPSRFAVSCFVEALMAWGDIRALHGKKVLSVGPMTERGLMQVGIRPDASPNSFGGIEALSEELGRDFSGRYFYPCSDASPQDKRIESVRAHGIDLQPQVFYTNRPIAYAQLP
ncbi:MAG: hydroxymethylbilane synthase, partial [Verrucomicrobiales bacterium]